MEDVLPTYQDENHFRNTKGRTLKLRGFRTDLGRGILPLASSSVLVTFPPLPLFVQRHESSSVLPLTAGYSFPSEGSHVM